MRIIVCGGRNYFDKEKFYQTMGGILKNLSDVTIISGGASGADALAKQFARENGISFEEFPAEWERLGKSAGPIRNQKMIDSGADLVVAFPGGKGTTDMVRRANRVRVTAVHVK